MSRERSGRITGIDVLKHKHGPGYDADAFAERVVQAQSLEVAAVRGASGSSKAMKKAIENALMKGLSLLQTLFGPARREKGYMSISRRVPAARLARMRRLPAGLGIR